MFWVLQVSAVPTVSWHPPRRDFLRTDGVLAVFQLRHEVVDLGEIACIACGGIHFRGGGEVVAEHVPAHSGEPAAALPTAEVGDARRLGQTGDLADLIEQAVRR
jgi:hypothetical protein